MGQWDSHALVGAQGGAGISAGHFLFAWPCSTACGVSRPGSGPGCPAVEVQSPDPWTTGEFPQLSCLFKSSPAVSNGTENQCTGHHRAREGELTALHAALVRVCRAVTPLDGGPGCPDPSSHAADSRPPAEGCALGCGCRLPRETAGRRRTQISPPLRGATSGMHSACSPPPRGTTVGQDLSLGAGSSLPGGHSTQATPAAARTTSRPTNPGSSHRRRFPPAFHLLVS